MAKLAASKTILFSVLAALFIPVVYGVLLLSATWGPYDNLSKLPVAVVNNDLGAMNEDTPINVGQDLVKNLKDGKALGWDFVSSTDAMKGMENNKYYMTIVIPEDFSERVTTVMNPNPKKLELEYIQNEGLNFLASQVTKSATERIREQLSNTITEQYVGTVVGQASEGFKKAADGSTQLAVGTEKLQEGTNKLNESVVTKSADIEQLADGASQLKNGTGQLYSSLTSKQADITKLASGSKQLKVGTALLLSNLKGSTADIERLASGAKELHAGTVTLKDGTGKILAGLQKAQPGSERLFVGMRDRLIPGSRKVADGAAAVQAGSAQLAAGAKELVKGLEDYKMANPTVQIGPYYEQIFNGAKKISAGLDTLSTSSVGLTDGANQVANGLEETAGPGAAALSSGINELLAGQQQVDLGASKLQTGAQALADGNEKVLNGWNEVTAGVSQLDNGAAQISAGNQAVDSGWKQLTNGANQLNNGMSQVSNGTQQVNEGWKTLAAGTTELNEGAGKVKDGTKELASGLKDGAEKTAALSTGKENISMFAAPVELKGETVNDYNQYRDSTAPYVMTLALFVGTLILSLFIKFTKPDHVSTVGWYLAKYLQVAGLALVQGVLLLLTVFLLEVHMTNPMGVIFFTVAISLIFAGIVLFLVSLGGNIGRFIALAFVVLQLSTTGANLPVEMLPDYLQSMSKYLPFTYSIAGFKNVISLDNWNGMVSNMLTLFLFLGLSSLLTLGVFFIRYRTNKDQKEVSVG